MKLTVLAIVVLVLAPIIAGPFFIKDNDLAQVLYGLITTSLAAAVCIWATWKYSKNLGKEQLTRYGLLAWRNIDALSLKVRQQIQIGAAEPDVMESWLLDIDQAKWGWRDLLRELFELQKRLEVESEELSQKYSKKMDLAESETDRDRLNQQLKLELAKLSGKAPLPLAEREQVECANCRALVELTLGPQTGDTSWPVCNHCGAKFPVHRKSDSEIVVNASALRLPVKTSCPHCSAIHTTFVPAKKALNYPTKCKSCGGAIICKGTASSFEISIVSVQDDDSPTVVTSG